MNDGGTDDPANLQAVHPLVNRAKGTMGNQQFIDMCKAVASHANGVRRLVADADIETVQDKLVSVVAYPPRQD
jgi:hypothetical protein